MASLVPRSSSRYSSVDSSFESPSDLKNPTNNRNLSSLKRLVTNSSGRRHPSDPPSSTAIIRQGSGSDLFAPSSKPTNSLGAMVKKFMEKRPNNNLKSGSTAGRTALPIPPDPIAQDLKKRGKASNFSALHLKLFHKGGSADRTAGKALTEVKANTRTLAMVLRSERELLSQNNEYEAEVSELRLLLQEKNREVDRLKDLCLKQREEIKALKDAILFPDVMNSQLHDLLEKQGTELNQARQIIPSLQKQVSSLTGQIQCLAVDLAEVKADKYAVRTCLDGHGCSPQTPQFDQETANSLEYSSIDPMTSGYGSPDDMFLKDLNPCLTPRFSKSQSKEYDGILVYEFQSKDNSFCISSELNSDTFFSSPGGILSHSSDRCQRPSLCGSGSSAQKIHKSDESEWSSGKSKRQYRF